MSRDPVTELRAAVEKAVGTVGGQVPPELSFERPKRPEQGDYSTNAPMLLARDMAATPREVAARVAEELRAELSPGTVTIEIAGPGFLNLVISDEWYRHGVDRILSEDRFGTGEARGPGVNLEFVSANPTGPLTAAGGRGAAYGDSLGRVLEAAGHDVKREYYMNDAGAQIDLFGASLAASMRGDEQPSDGYSGAYIDELAQEFVGSGVPSDDEAAVARLGVEAMRRRIEGTLERFGVTFDEWASERDLRERKAIDEVLGQLRSDGHTYEREGALWLRTTDWGDDKDRVLIRSDGEPTYFAADIAYHQDKVNRGAEQMIVPLGADHHGYVPRMKAAVGMLTGDPDRYEAPILQLVNVVENGHRKQMSKRRGEFVTLDELMDDIGADAARFFLLERSPDSVIDLDLELARSRSQENPVYYVQYAHARIASILRKASAESAPGAGAGPAGEAAGETLPCEPSERALIKRLLSFPSEVEVAADRRAPHRICSFAQAVAADFHAFYRDCKVVGADEETGIDGSEAARLRVCLASQQVIGECLDLLGVSAPERM